MYNLGLYYSEVLTSITFSESELVAHSADWLQTAIDSTLCYVFLILPHCDFFKKVKELQEKKIIC
jgi:hypothetical protein